MRKKIKLLSALVFVFALNAQADDYKIDIPGQHAFINFKVKHLGYSWLLGDFKKFRGNFTYDESNPSATKIKVVIDTTSIDSNHAARDKHLRGKDFLNVSKYPEAQFVSTSYKENSDGTGEMKGSLTLNGVTRLVTLKTEKIGEGRDPWGGYRSGFSATTEFAMKDFNIKKDLGPASTHVFLDLHIEGIRQ